MSFIATLLRVVREEKQQQRFPDVFHGNSNIAWTSKLQSVYLLVPTDVSVVTMSIGGFRGVDCPPLSLYTNLGLLQLWTEYRHILC